MALDQQQIEKVTIPTSLRRLVFTKSIPRDVSTRIEKQTVEQLKPLLRSFLAEVVEMSIQDGVVKERTGYLFKALRKGILVTNATTISGITGEIRGPWYARLLERGGVIKAKAAEGLTIPMEAARHPDGRPKRSGPNAWRQYKTYWWRSERTGQTYLVYNRKSRGDRVFLYVLVDKVRMQKKLNIGRNIDKLMPSLANAVANLIANNLEANDIMKAFDEGAKRSVSSTRGIAMIKRKFMPR